MRGIRKLPMPFPGTLLLSFNPKKRIFDDFKNVLCLLGCHTEPHTLPALLVLFYLVLFKIKFPLYIRASE